LAVKELLLLIVDVLIGLLLLPLLSFTIVALGILTFVALPFTFPPDLGVF